MPEKNPLIEINLRAMEYIWTQIPKEEKNGIKYVTYVKTDLPYLYYSGLVDTQHYTLEQWEKAFEDCLGEDGCYWVSHEKMLSLGRFRYCKSVNEPFDPLKMRTGKYSVDRLWKLFENSIIPSTSLPKTFLKNIYDQLLRDRKDFKKLFKNEIQIAQKKGTQLPEEDLKGIYLEKSGDEWFTIIEKEDLIRIKKILDMYPSPRRKLELAVQEMRQQKLQQLSDVAKAPQKSTFEAGQDFRETTKKSLKEMLVKAPEQAAAGRKPSGEVIKVGDVQKKKRPPTKF